MPDRPLTIATYAAGASLMAITLVYVFGPTFFLDNDAAHSSKLSRKKGVVGLVNPANDCFINSILQALAGLPELRAYLIREVYRRKLDGPAVYADASSEPEEAPRRNGGKRIPEWMRIGLQQGVVTAGLKEMLDALNERPIFKKTISAQSFIRAVERAFNTRISRSQQDAQEFLQVIVERLADEYSAGRRVRQRQKSVETGLENPSLLVDEVTTQTKRLVVNEEGIAQNRRGTSSKGGQVSSPHINNIQDRLATESSNGEGDDEEAFPIEGRLESQIECLVCHFKPKPTVSSFLTLTLNVPVEEASTTLNACFDGVFKVEHIEDFKCDRCRLEHALQVNEGQISRATSEERATLESDRRKLEIAFHEDPENAPKDVHLPPLSSAPKRRITRHTRMSAFPQLLVLHLSRSIWDPHCISSKNMARVSFPEILALGGLLDRKTYRLLGVVTHKGGHHSGHYESFRRQMLVPPYSTRASLGTGGVYSLRNSPIASVTSSPQLRSTSIAESAAVSMISSTTVDQESRSSSVSDPSPDVTLSHSEPSRARPKPMPTPPLESIPAPGLPDPPMVEKPPPATPFARTSSIRGSQRRKKKHTQHQQDRWWRISDEKVKECKTSEVLGMQREVYLLFYEMIVEENVGKDI